MSVDIQRAVKTHWFQLEPLERQEIAMAMNARRAGLIDDSEHATVPAQMLRRFATYHRDKRMKTPGWSRENDNGHRQGKYNCSLYCGNGPWPPPVPEEKKETKKPDGAAPPK
jgi:hypothetical protein